MSRRCNAAVGAVAGLAVLVLCSTRVWSAVISIRVAGQPASAEKLAARELQTYLQRLYPNDRFLLGAAGGTDATILLGTTKALASEFHNEGRQLLTHPGGFRVTATRADKPVGYIVGQSPRGVIHGVYRLLEKLGFGFYLSFETAPAPRTEHFTFDQWDLADYPLVQTRLVFNWHNFISGCTGWNLDDWKQWIAGSQKMGFNTVMVHAYGNNPMYTFSFNGIEKPVGWLATSRRGRDWGNEHVNDVRRLAGGEIFDTAEFGSDAAVVPDDRRVEAAQALMKQVFAYAETRGMDVCFALDVDTVSTLPQDMIMTLRESARFYNGSLWLPRPDTEPGYRFYKAQVDALFALYPQIDILALWRRSNAQQWGQLKKPSQLPDVWRAEYEQFVARHPGANKLPQAVASFALSKVAGAFRRALDERGCRQVRMAMGSWETSWIPACAAFLPADVTLMPLDSSCFRYRRGSFLDMPAAFADLLKARDRILPIIWAQHDDGAYIGRPLAPHPHFHDTLTKLNARGYGIIHWMTRPLDLYFKYHENQVWASTRNQSYTETCRTAAAHWFGPPRADRLGAYLRAWWTRGPIFGRVTTDHFFRGRESIPEPEHVIRECRERIAVLEQVDVTGMTARQKQRLAYFKALEQILISFCEVQELAYRPALKALQSGDYARARQLLRSADPAETMRRFAQLSQMAGGDRGEEAMVISLGTRWRTDYLAAAQLAGLAPVRIKYAPTRHEPLAQGRGHYTFCINASREYWAVRGAQELNRKVSDQGLLVDSPTTLNLAPIVPTRGLFAPGTYELTLRMAGSSGESAVDLDILLSDDGKTWFKITPRKGMQNGAGRQTVKLGLHQQQARFSIVLPKPGTVRIRLQPTRGSVVVSNSVLKPKP